MRECFIMARSGNTTRPQKGRRYDCSLTRVREQMDRLFRASVTLIYEGEGEYRRISLFVADKQELWWDPKRPQESTLWESKIELGEKLFNEIIRRPVPLNMNILKTLKRSALGLGLYLWLTYRTFSLKQPIRLSWKRIYRQFGLNPAKVEDWRTVDDFRTKCLRELTKIKTAWPGLKYSTARGSAGCQTLQAADLR